MIRYLTWRVLNGSRRVVADLAAYQTATIDLRWLDTSTWAITCQAGTEPAALLAIPGYGITVDLDGQPLLSGPVTRWVTEQTTAGDETVTISGTDYLGRILGTRITWPLPTGTVSTTTISKLAADNYIYPTSGTAPAETVIKHYVTVNAINRLAVPGLTVAATLGRGLPAAGSARFKTLTEVVSSLGDIGKVGVRAPLNEQTGTLTFDVTIPVDRSRSILLTREMQNVSSATYSQDAPLFTRCLVAGAGEAANRDLIQVIDTVAEGLWPAAEGFVDARDVDAGLTALLIQRGTEFLTENAARTTVSCVAEDSPQMTLGVDYNLGDYVNALGVTEQVRGITIEDTVDDGVTIRPTIGNPAGATDLGAVRAAFETFRRDIKRLERR